MSLFSFKRTVPAGPPEFLIVGLGNPGREYENTRHNTGFICIDHIADECGVDIKKIEFKAVTARCTIAGHNCILMKPQTFMNLSGEAVRPCAAFFKIPAENIIVIYDDITMDVGKMRIRRKGSDGGHNGMKSIIYQLGSDNFPRIRVGIGAKPHPDYNLADWVISSFAKEDVKPLEQAAENAFEAVKEIVNGRIDNAMNKFNS